MRVFLSYNFPLFMEKVEQNHPEGLVPSGQACPVANASGLDS